MLMSKNQEKTTMPKIKNQTKVLKEARGKKTISEFCLDFPISRPTYYKWEGGGDMELDKLQDIALNRVGEWQGDVAVELIRLVNEYKVPCKCQTEIGDNGACPKHLKQTMAVV